MATCTLSWSTASRINRRTSCEPLHSRPAMAWFQSPPHTLGTAASMQATADSVFAPVVDTTQDAATPQAHQDRIGEQTPVRRSPPSPTCHAGRVCGRSGWRDATTANRRLGWGVAGPNVFRGHTSLCAPPESDAPGLQYPRRTPRGRPEARVSWSRRRGARMLRTCAIVLAESTALLAPPDAAWSDLCSDGRP